MSFARLVKRHGFARCGDKYVPNARAERKRELRELGREQRDLTLRLMDEHRGWRAVERPGQTPAEREGLVKRGAHPSVYRAMRSAMRRLMPDLKDKLPAAYREAVRRWNLQQDRAFRQRIAAR